MVIIKFIYIIINLVVREKNTKAGQNNNLNKREMLYLLKKN